MDANEYQRRASLTAAPQNDADRAANAVLGLAGEAAELAHLLLNGGWRGSMQVQHALRAIEALGTLIEPVKKVIYQGHEPPVYADFMASFDHQRLVMRQWGDWSYREPHEDRSIWALTPAVGDLLTTDREFADELGDAQWYVAQGARAIGWDLGIVMSGNLLKLERRYPDGRFTPEASQGRTPGSITFSGGVLTQMYVNLAEPPPAPAPTLPAITGLHLVPALDGSSFDLVWDATGLPYAVELEGSPTMFFCGSGRSSGAWMRKSTPYQLRVRLQDGARFGPWSDWVTITPQVPVTITGVAIDTSEDERTVRVDTVWPALPTADLEWEDNSVYTGYWTPTSDWLLPRRWHDYQVRFRWRLIGLPHGEWSDWAIVPARPLPEVRGLRVEQGVATHPASDALTYARLVWDNREPEIGYEVEFLETGNRYWLNESGSIAQSNVPLALRVRAAVQGREGPWSEPVTLPPDPELTPPPNSEPGDPAPITLRMAAVGAQKDQRIVALEWEGGRGRTYVVDVSNDAAFEDVVAQYSGHGPAATIFIDWTDTPFMRVRGMDWGRVVSVSNVIHVPPAPPREPEPFSRVQVEPGAGFAPATTPCQHPMMDVLSRPVVAGRPTVYARCTRCGVEQWLDEETEQPIGPFQPAPALAESDRLFKAHRNVREALNQRTVEMRWIVTEDVSMYPSSPTEAAAIEKAEHLGRTEGKKFFVWQLVGQVEPAEAPVRWVKASDLPF